MRQQLDELEDAPLTEPIRTMTDRRREGIKRRRPNRDKTRDRCYKGAYSRKQALTQMNYLLSTGRAKNVATLRIYKCRRCRQYHLTHKPERTQPYARSI
jgi:hypothetical protein